MNRVLTKGLFFVALQALTSVLVADLQEVEQLYAKGEYEKAYVEFAQLAAVGNVDAFYRIGEMFYQGNFVEKNLLHAYAWKKLANEVDEYFDYLTLRNTLTDSQLVKAEEYFISLKEKVGAEHFKNRFSPIFDLEKDDLDYGAPKPKVKVAPLFPKIAAREGVTGNVLVSFRINTDGRISDAEVLAEYPEAYGFSRGLGKALKRYEFEKPLGDESKSTYSIEMFRFQTNLPERQKQKFDQLVHEAEAGDARAQFNLSMQTAKVFGVVSTPHIKSRMKGKYQIPVNPEYSNAMLLASAQQGYAPAQAYLAMRLRFGRGVVQDIAKSSNWLKQAESNGSEYARKQLIMLNNDL